MIRPRFPVGTKGLKQDPSLSFVSLLHHFNTSHLRDIVGIVDYFPQEAVSK
jgi:hypothetical protein